MRESLFILANTLDQFSVLDGVFLTIPNHILNMLPHWFHVAGNYDDGKGGGRETDYDEDGQLWLAWSRPIGPSWIGPYRTPSKLLRATVARFWKDAK